MLLRKSDYTYEYKDGSENLNEISLPEKEEFYNKLNVKRDKSMKVYI